MAKGLIEKELDAIKERLAKLEAAQPKKANQAKEPK
jgi:hypothetical protein